jgi:hypothetical protein
MWVNNGLENDEVKLMALAKESCGFTRYKFLKYWAELSKIFILRDGKLFFERDEEKRFRLMETSDKRQKASRIANDARWRSGGGPVDEQGEETVSESDNVIQAEFVMASSESEGIPPPQPDTETHTDRGNPPPPTTEETAARAQAAGGGGGGSPPSHVFESAKPTAVDVTITDAEFRMIQLRSVHLGMPVPSRALALEIRKKFKNLPCEELIRMLPRFPGQEGPGLWASKSRSELELETSRQISPESEPKPKPTQKQQQFLKAYRSMKQKQRS